MKFTLSLILIMVLSFSCEHEAPNPARTKQHDISSLVAQIDVPELIQELPKDVEYDTRISVYKYPFDSEDSIENCSIKRYDGINVERSGPCYYQLPHSNEYVPDGILEIGEVQAIYETYDPLVCEAGGNSAYDRYVFDKDSKGRVEKVRHYMAWQEDYSEDGEVVSNDKPNYFLGHIIEFQYTENSRTIHTYTEDLEIMSIETNIYDDQGRLQIQTWGWEGEDTYKAFYYY